MYHQTPILSDYPCYITGGGIAITVVRAAILPDATIVVLVRRLHISLIETLEHCSLFIYLLYFFFLRKTFTTDYRTTIYHVYPDLPEPKITVNILESYLTDHKCLQALIK